MTAKSKSTLFLLLSAFFILATTAGAFTQGAILRGEDLVSGELKENMSLYYPGSTGYLALVADIADEWHINSHTPLDNFLIPTTIEVEAPRGIEITKILYPEPVMEKLGISEGKMPLYKGRTVFGIRFKVGKDVKQGTYGIKATLRYQGCNNFTCIEPASKTFEKRIRIGALNELTESKNSDIFSLPVFLKDEKEVSSDRSGGEGEITGIIEKKGLFLAFVFIFLGGLALNLTPCIYPIIPITVSYFGGQARGKTSRVFLLALIYVFGMSMTYSILGTIAAMTGSLFGSALQNPWVIAFIAAVLLALATSMFDLWEIRMPTFLTRRTGSAKQGYFGALLMGLTVGIVAAPCIGPFVLGLLTYVGRIGKPALGFFMFFTLAWGMGIPFIVLGTLSGSLNKLPRSGDWMVWVRKIFGFILIAMAFYFLKPVIGKAATTIGYGATALAAGIYLGWMESSKGGTTFTTLKKVVGAAAIVVSILIILVHMGVFPGQGAEASIDWKEFNESLLEEARASGTPVIIDFSADWCIPCHELEEKCFPDERVIEQAGKFVTLKVDMTRVGEKQKKLKKRFDIRGVPTIIFIGKNGEEIKDIRITGFIEADELLKRMQKAIETE